MIEGTSTRGVQGVVGSNNLRLGSLDEIHSDFLAGGRLPVLAPCCRDSNNQLSTKNYFQLKFSDGKAAKL
jgi:hypothetical protein